MTGHIRTSNQPARCGDLMDIDEEAGWIVCDLETGHPGDHHATGAEATHPHRTYTVTWQPGPHIVPGEVVQ